ncbi:MAG: hypothetical protein DRM97_06990, partial [Thermoprotei archaeon]
MMRRLTKFSKEWLTLSSLIGIAILLVYLWLMTPKELLSLVSLLTPVHIITTIALELLHITLYGVGWWFLLRSIDRHVGLKESLIGAYVSVFGDIMIPTGSITGESLRFIYAVRRLKFKHGSALATIVMHRVLNGITFAFFVVTSYIMLMRRASSLSEYVLLAMATVLLSCAVAIFLLEMPRIKDKLLSTILRGHERRGIKGYLARLVEELAEAVEYLKGHTANLFLSLIALMTQWIVGILIPYLIFHALNYNVSFWLVSFAYPIYGLIVLVPVGIPAMIGVLDVTMMSIF